MLFCKPSPKAGILYEASFEKGQCFQLRPLDMKKDLSIMHYWIHQPYSKFWQTERSIEQLHSNCQSILKSPDAHVFTGIMDEQVICFIEVYRVPAGELGQHIEAKFHDCGMRLLMAPCEQPIPRLSCRVMEAFMRYFFSFAAARYLYAEPDIHHTKACRLLEKSGFSFLQNIMLDTKAASLYLMTRNQFHATHRHPAV